MIVEDWLDWERVEPVALQLHNLIKEEVAKDTRKLYPTEAFHKNMVESISAGRRGTPGIKEFIEGRAKFLREHKDLQAPAPVIEKITTGVTALPGEDTMIHADVAEEPVVTTAVLHYRLDDHGPFHSLTMKNESGHFEAAIPGAPAGTSVEYYIEARTAEDAAASFAPRYGERTPESFRVAIVPRKGGSAVLINELMAANVDTVADPQGDFDDWIEIHNTSEDVIDLAGYTLSDNEDNLDKWSFPKNTTIAPGGFLLVWADEDGKKKKGLHANFKLAKSGEIVVFSNPAGEVLDVVRYESLKDNTSLARNGESWSEQEKATPAKANQ